MNTRILLTLSASAILAVASHAAQLPSIGGFKFVDNGLTLTGATGANSVLADFTVNGHTYSGVTFTTTPLDLTSAPGGIGNESGSLNGGLITLTDPTAPLTPLLTISFDFGYIEPGQFGASAVSGVDPFGVDTVDFGGTLVNQTDNLSNDFNFSLSPNGQFTAGTLTASGNFQAVPEPGTWAALGLGGLAVLRRRRKA